MHKYKNPFFFEFISGTFNVTILHTVIHGLLFVVHEMHNLYHTVLLFILLKKNKNLMFGHTHAVPCNSIGCIIRADNIP